MAKSKPSIYKRLLRCIICVLIAMLCFGHLSAPAAANEVDLKLKALENDIAKLKEDVLQQKILLRQVEQAALFGDVTSTSAFVTLKNEAEGFFNFVAAEFYLNNKLIQKLDQNKVSEPTKSLFLIYSGEVPPGSHTLKLALKFRGQKNKAFSYFKDYEFTLDSAKDFHVDQGKAIAIGIVVQDKGYFKTELSDRLAITYNVTNGS